MKIDEFKLNDDIKIEYAHYIEYKEEIEELEERKNDLIKYREKIITNSILDKEELQIIDDSIKIYQDNIDNLKHKYGRNIASFFIFEVSDIEEVLLMLANITFPDKFKIDYKDYNIYITNDCESKKYCLYDKRCHYINYLEYSPTYNFEDFDILNKFIISMIDYRVNNDINVADKKFCMNYLKTFVKNSCNYISYSKKCTHNKDVDSYINYRLSGKYMVKSYPIDCEV